MLVNQIVRADMLSEHDVWRFLLNCFDRDELSQLTEGEKKKLLDPKSGFGTFSQSPDYHKKVYAEPLWRAVKLITGKKNAKVLDIGCGVGTQAILFAMLGSDVQAIDFSDEQLEVARKRRSLYEKILSNPLSIKFSKVDITDVDFKDLGTFDIMYSHACISRHLSADEIFSKLKNVLNGEGLIILKNANPKYLPIRISNRQNDVSSLSEYIQAAHNHGFRTLYSGGTTLLPRKFWVGKYFPGLLDSMFKPFPGSKIHLEMIATFAI